MLPLGLCLIRKTHLQLTIFYEGCNETSSQVSLRINAVNSSLIVICHLGSFIAWVTHEGSSDEGKGCLVTVKIVFGLNMLFWEQIFMG